MTQDRNVEILRLAPYNCELNRIEVIWADSKETVARKKNSTFKLADVNQLIQEAIDGTGATKQATCHKKKQNGNEANGY